MATLAEIRTKYPQYDDLSDAELADRFHQKFYSDMPRDQFDAKIGFARTPSPEAAPDPIAARADKIEAIRQPGWFGDMTDAAAKGIPFIDEIYSAVTALPRAAVSAVRGEGFDPVREYENSQALQAELERRREARSPIASVAGEVLGGLGVGGVAAKSGLSLLQNAKPTLASLAGRGAAEGAAYGALYGAGEGEGLQERGNSALYGAGLGATVGGVTGAVASIGANKAAKETVPGIDKIRTAAREAYEAADNAGVIYTPKAVERLQADMVKDFTDFGFEPTLQPGAAAVFRKVRDLSGQNVTLKGLDSLRKIAGNAYIPGNKANNALVAKAIERIDNIVAMPSAGELLTGNAQTALPALSKARQLWSRAAKAEQVETAINRAKLRAASTGSGGNVDNAVRQNLRRVLEKGTGFTAAEKAALEKVVTGTKGQNALRLAGKLSPSGNGLMAALGIGGTMINPAVGAASLAGLGAKSVADGMTMRNAALLDLIIRNGGALPAATLGGGRKALTDLGARTGGLLGGGTR